MVGGGGRRVLTLAARAADIVSISNVPFVARNEAGLDPPAEAKRRAGYVRAAAADRFENMEIESSPYFAEITDDPQAALADLAAKTGIAVEVLRNLPMC